MQTRFQRGMERLGILVIYSKIPEGKGRVERIHRTNQDRLVKKMRVKGIKKYEEANEYLKEYCEKYNSKFGVKAVAEGDNHTPLTQEEKKEMEWLFAKEEERTVKRDGTISYNNVRYQLSKGTILKKNKVKIKESIYGNVRICE